MVRHATLVFGLLMTVVLLAGGMAVAQPGGPGGPNSKVSGLVLDADDNPVAGVRVLAQSPESYYGEMTAAPLNETTTDERGRFALETSYSPTVVAHKEGYALGYASSSYPGYGELLVRLAPNPRVVSGRVLTPDGQPIAGAEVTVTNLTPSTGGPEQYVPSSFYGSDTWRALLAFLAVKSDDKGGFTLACLPANTAVTVEAVAEGKTRGLAQIQDDGADPTIVLHPEAVISGRVTSKGQPVAGVSVSASYDLEDNMTGPGGPQAGGPGGAPGGPVPPPPPPPPMPAQVRAMGAEFARMYYTAYYSSLLSGFRGTEKTGADGSFTLRHLPAGNITVTAMPMDERITADPKPILVKAGEKVENLSIELLKGGTVRGKVIDAATGKPIVGAMVAVAAPIAEDTVPGGPMNGSEYEGGYGHGYESDGQSNVFGVYQLRLFPGKYSLYCHSPSGRYEPTPDPTPVVVEDEKTVGGINFALKPVPALQGQVLAPDGRPTGDVELIYTGDEDEAIHLDVAADGAFELPAGTWTQPTDGYSMPPALLARNEATGWAAFVMSAPGQDSVNVQMQPGGFLDIDISDHTDKPLPNVPVWVCREYGEMGQIYSITNARSNEAGHVTLGPLPTEQPLKLVLDCPMVPLIVSEDWRDLKPITLNAGQRVQMTPLKFNPEGRSVKVFVGDDQQRPVAGAMVYASGTEQAVTDAQGMVELKKLPVEGKVVIAARHPSQALFAAQAVDPDWGQWPGLLLKPLGSATGQIRTKDDQPLAGAMVYCTPSAGEDMWTIAMMIGLRGFSGGDTATTDAEGRWQAKSLLPGLAYQVHLRPAGDEDPMHFGSVGGFTANGGTELQDVGIMTWDAEKPKEQ